MKDALSCSEAFGGKQIPGRQCDIATGLGVRPCCRVLLLLPFDTLSRDGLPHELDRIGSR